MVRLLKRSWVLTAIIPASLGTPRSREMRRWAESHSGTLASRLNYSEVTVGIVLLHRMAFFEGRIRRVFFSSLTQTNTIDRMSSPLGEKMKWCTNGNDGEVLYMSRTILWRKKNTYQLIAGKKKKERKTYWFFFPVSGNIWNKNNAASLWWFSSAMAQIRQF